MTVVENRRASRRPVKKILITAPIVIAGAIAIFIIWLLAWDGGFASGKQRELLPGVQLNLQTATTARGPVEYDMYGTEGPVILSIHAGLGGADQGRLFASWLQNDGYRILSPSRPGYLGTPLTSGKTPEEQAALLAALLDELNIDKVGVFTASAGGPVAYTFAANYPDRVWGLVSVGGTSLPKPGKAKSGNSFRKIFMSSIGQKLTKLTADFSIKSVLSSTLNETSEFTGKQKEERISYIMNTPGTKAMFKAMFNTTFPYGERTEGTDNDAAQLRAMQPLPLERIHTPSLIIHGTLDGDVPFDNGKYTYEHIPDAQRYWMESGDHLGFWLSPEAGKAQEAARTFLRQHTPVK